MDFRSIYRHGFARVAACTTRCTLADPAANAAGDPGGGARPATGAAWRSRCSRNSACPATRSATCCTSPRCWTRWRTPSRTWSPRPPICCRCCWSARRCAMPARCTTARWRSIAAGCWAWCRRCTCPTTANSTSRGISSWATAWRAARSPSARQTAPFGTDLLFAAEDVPDLVVHAEICEDIWIPIPPSSRGRAGRRDGAGQPVGQQHHDRQGGDPAPAVRLAVGALRRGLSVRRGRARASPPPISPGTARPRSSRTARRWPRPSASHRPASSPSPISTSTCCATSACRWAASTPTAGAIPRPFAASASAWIRRPAISVWSARSSAFRSCRPMPRGSSRIATRPTTSRSPAWRSGCARPASSAW